MPHDQITLCIIASVAVLFTSILAAHANNDREDPALTSVVIGQDVLQEK